VLGVFPVGMVGARFRVARLRSSSSLDVSLSLLNRPIDERCFLLLDDTVLVGRGAGE
jgi:hypothetical protein